MRQILRSMLAQLFKRSRVNLKKHLATPRAALFDVERQLARQLRARFRNQFRDPRRAA